MVTPLQTPESKITKLATDLQAPLLGGCLNNGELPTSYTLPLPSRLAVLKAGILGVGLVAGSVTTDQLLGDPFHARPEPEVRILETETSAAFLSQITFICPGYGCTYPRDIAEALVTSYQEYGRVGYLQYDDNVSIAAVGDAIMDTVHSAGVFPRMGTRRPTINIHGHSMGGVFGTMIASYLKEHYGTRTDFIDLNCSPMQQAGDIRENTTMMNMINALGRTPLTGGRGARFAAVYSSQDDPNMEFVDKVREAYRVLSDGKALTNRQMIQQIVRFLEFADQAPTIATSLEGADFTHLGPLIENRDRTVVNSSARRSWKQYYPIRPYEITNGAHANPNETPARNDYNLAILRARVEAGMQPLRPKSLSLSV